MAFRRRPRKCSNKNLLSKKAKNKKYNISGNNEICNIDLINSICEYLNKKIQLNVEKFDHKNLIQFVDDRPDMIKNIF